MATSTSGSKIETYLGSKAESLLGFKNRRKFPRTACTSPAPTFIDDVYAVSDRNIRVLTNLQRMFDHGRLARHRLPLDPPRRSGHRALRRRELRQESRLFRR